MSASFDLDTFLRQPRLGGLALSPDGSRLVVGVATPAPDGQRYRTALWELDPDGQAPPRRLTRSAPGEGAPVFTRDGTLLFVSARPDPDAKANGDAEPTPALWALPAEGGEARLVLAPPGGVGAVEVARDADAAIVTSSIHPGADDFAADQDQQKARKEAGVTAQLFETYPIRHWDAYLGPREPGRWYLDATALADHDPTSDHQPTTDAVAADRERPADDASATSRDDAADSPTEPGDDEPAVTDPPLLARGLPLTNVDGALTPDGSTYLVGWRRLDAGTQLRDPSDLVADLVAIDVATGERRTIVADGRWWDMFDVSPDGRRVAAVALDVGAPDRPTRPHLAVVDLDDGTVTELATDAELWPEAPRWLPGGDALVVESDHLGERHVFRVDLDSGEVVRLTASGAYTEVRVARDGERLYAMRATVDRPPRPVQLDTSTPHQEPHELPSPVGVDPANVRTERIVATADDGVEVGSWLVLPADASPDEPAPLVVFIHGGPLGSWNNWSWRWNPALLAERGFAVLLPDPALSTGYGQSFIARGWGRWGEEPFTDLMAAVDAAVDHEAVDPTRTAAMGGSFGGYMANWVAGHTDRFRCIVTHASLWHLEGFHGTTDLGLVWEREFGDPYLDVSRYREHSPHRFVGEIRTPMLVIHGEKDYRVPISEALTLWTDLSRNGVDARFLYFPDENHWILKPQNARLWYETVFAFLDEHLHDAGFQRPTLL